MPLEHLADYTDALTEVFARHGTRGTWYAHASVGTLHVRPILDLRRAGPQGGAPKMRAIAEEAAELVRKYKGAYSGEHGDGLCRGEWIAWQFGPAITEAFRAIKQKLDPIGLFNPGKIIDPPDMDDGSAVALRVAGHPAALSGHRPTAEARLVGLGRAERPDHGSDHAARHWRRRHRRLRQGRRDVQQQRPLPQVRCRDHVPELSRDAR